MTFREYAENYCDRRGMFPKDIKQVVDLLVQVKDEPMRNRWNDQVENYPDIVLNVITIALNTVAYEWINENQPNAWYKELFKCS